MDVDYVTVSQITDYISNLISDDSRLKHILIKGELSNVKLYSSGHLYYKLKDENCQIDGVMFSARRRLKFEPEDGMTVLIEGKIEVYKKQGAYKLYANKISEYGIGELHRAYEQLKEKLLKEGLFDESHKKKIPNFPKKIGVITASNGAAIRDIITTIERRWPLCEVILFPSLVQGDRAAYNIVKQIRVSNSYELDLLIIGRGGGSIEDLWSFNEEIVAREIYSCETPIISAVGHEVDFTISDFVADLRAATPTAAAERATPKLSEIKYTFNQLKMRLINIMQIMLHNYLDRLEKIKNKSFFENPFEICSQKEMISDMLLNRLEHLARNLISVNSNRLDLVKGSFVFKNPDSVYSYNRFMLDDLIKRVEHSFEDLISDNIVKLNLIKNSNIFKNQEILIDKHQNDYLIQVSKLEVLNPLNTIKRGYTLTRVEGKIISSSKDVQSDDELEVEFKDGKVNTKVI